VSRVADIRLAYAGHLIPTRVNGQYRLPG